MEERALKFTAVFLLVCTVVVFATLPLFPQIRVWETRVSEAWAAKVDDVTQYEARQQLKVQQPGFGQNVADGKLRLKLPEGVSRDKINITNDYVTQTIRVEIPETDKNYLSKYAIVGSSNHVKFIYYEQKGALGIVEILMDQVYELDLSYEEESIVFSFLTPQEVYDKVVVIDAGHGGGDPGTIRQGIYEKDLNLAIALQLKEILEAEGEDIGVYYTRTDETNPSLEQRVELANKSGANLFLSIHNNSLNGRMSKTSGTQVLFGETSEESRRLAQICLNEMTGILESDNRGLVEGNAIYIIRTSEVPVALIEVGFMTNQEELNLLCTEAYQEKAARGIYNAMRSAFAEGY
ncbi:MAG: N-acetylmuramoyl-L-alanine amidase [Clostridiales bacterium]|nr:N-acetylmuramoyl-L-alanine amidase [Clostridiales bacterium]